MRRDAATPNLNLSREAQARAEVGVTEIERAPAWLACLGFALLVAGGAIFQAVDGEPGDLPFGLLVARGVPDECAIQAFDRAAENGAAISRRLREPVQAALARLGRGNAAVANLGAGGLALAAERAHLTGPDFTDARVRAAREAAAGPCDAPVSADAVGALVDWRRQLAARGIHLVVVPTPGKLAAEPERFGAREPVRSAGRAAFERALAEAGVDVFDPLPVLRALRAERGASVYLERDSHWRPEAVEAVAEALAAHLRPALGAAVPGSSARAPRTQQSVRNVGDLAALLGFRGGAEAVELAAATPPPAAGAAPVLLLGDSFAAIYSSRPAFQRVFDASLHWGSDAGLADQLAWQLGLPVRSITRNAGGASASRQALAAEQARALSRGEADPLAGVRVVVLQFAARELSQGSWERVALAEPPPEGRVAEAAELQPEEPAEEISQAPYQEPTATPPGSDAPSAPEAPWTRMRGSVAARSPLPTPGTTPYADALFAVHLVDVSPVGEGEAGAAGEAPREIVVYLLGMRGQRLTPAARIPVGQEIDVVLAPWESPGVQAAFAPLFRTDLEDLSLLALPTYYGRILP